MASKPLLLCLMLAVAAMVLTGCANTFDAPFRPQPGWALTSYTIPLGAEVQGQSMEDLTLEQSQNYYVFLPWPVQIDLAWHETQPMGKDPHGSACREISYAEVEVLTVLGLFGRYRINSYGRAKDK